MVKTKRVTVFQVMKDNEVVAEFFDPVSARNKSNEIGGRIQITAKNIEIA
jgi:hypothetical protein